MSYRKTFSLLLAMALVLFTLAFTGAETTRAASTANSEVWKVVPTVNPGPTDNTFLGVAAISEKDIWAVGGYTSAGGSQQVLIERWNGRQWQLVPGQNPGANSNGLRAVTAISVNNVWAVGNYMDEQGVIRTLAERWDGIKWNVIPTPDPSTSLNILTGVVALSSDNIWAIGNQMADTGINQTLIEHWNGARWSVVRSPNLPGRSNMLKSISALSVDDIWAVGDAPDDLGQYVTLTMHWNGKHWSIVSSPSPGPTFSHLYGVAAISTHNIWAVGFYADQFWKSLVMHWDGSRWNVVDSPNPGTDSNVLGGITVVSPTNIWAVGYSLNTGDPSVIATNTLIEHWNGVRWSVVSSPNGGAGNNFLSGISRIPFTRSLWAVGYSTGTGYQTFSEYYDA